MVDVHIRTYSQSQLHVELIMIVKIIRYFDFSQIGHISNKIIFVVLNLVLVIVSEESLIQLNAEDNIAT